MAKPSVKAKLRAYFSCQARIHAEYEHSDKLEEEILAAMKVGEEVSFDTSGRKARLKDNFAVKNKAYRAHGIKRFEIELV